MITANWFFIIFTLFPSFFIGWSIKFFIYQSFGIFLRRQPEKEKNSWHLQNQTTWLIFSYLFSKEEHNLIMYKLHVQGCERIVSKSSLHLGQRNKNYNVRSYVWKRKPDYWYRDSLSSNTNKQRRVQNLLIIKIWQ